MELVKILQRLHVPKNHTQEEAFNEKIFHKNETLHKCGYY